MTSRPPLYRVRLVLVLLCVGGIGQAAARAQPADLPEQDSLEQAAGGSPEVVAAPKNLAELKQLETRVKQAVAKALPCVVGVKIGAAGGSAVIVNEKGLMLTAGHVVGKPKQKVTVFFADGKTVAGTTLGMYKSADAGMIQITDKGKWPCAEIGRSDDVTRGAWCLAVGHPFGFRPDRPPVVRVGRILGTTQSTIQTDCPLISGDSGGPLFDLDGKVIGINSRIGGSTTQNFHVPIDVFHDNWDRLAKGDAWEVETPRRDGSPVKHAFRDVVAEAGRCVVRVKCDGQDRVLGTIVGPDGWVLSKASEVTGKKIVCRFRDKKELPARVVGIDQQHDLVMLKIEATGLPSIEWNAATPEVGASLASVGQADEPLAIGAMSVPVRAIAPDPPKLGVVITDSDDGPQVVRVFPGTGGERAGLKAKDVITHVDGKEVKNRLDVTKIIQQFRLGDAIQLMVKRGEKSLDLSAKLAKIENEATKRRDHMNASGVGLSKRRHSFPAVLQHDTVIRPADCGGPIVDLDGKVVGINIARGGRTETYAVPSETLMTRMYDLMSGRLAPQQEPEAQQQPAADVPEKQAEQTEEQPESNGPPEASKEQPQPEPQAGEDKKPENGAPPESAPPDPDQPDTNGGEPEKEKTPPTPGDEESESDQPE